ncbi:alpha/beta hydrolase [Actinoplanes sp. NPDC051411]|jgi:pimeloyl-ACP methyl ester carboxylesterase|uniref:alpha/beta fold hydrolase n=1 Tax=Actinoplanes sp. NPDC051411 TaxID=3155522 RepID=UPI00343C1CA2
MERVELPDGRTLEYLIEGEADRPALVLHHGTPGGATRSAPLNDAALRLGFRVLTPGRPGYGGSTPQPGRRVADVAPDIAALLDSLGIADFVTLGWSGGGPHALACAALLPGRCRGAVSMAGVAPYDSPGLDWLAGMGEENVAEFGAALAGPSQLSEFMAAAEPAFAHITPETVVAAFGDLISDVDKKALEGPVAAFLAESSRHALSTGIAGWRDDDLAFVADWGFDPAALTVPVSIWQGDQDRMVPFTHGQWLSAHIPGADSHLVPGEGHISLINEIDAMLATFKTR